MTVTMLPGLIVGILLVGALLVAVLPLRNRSLSWVGAGAGLLSSLLLLWLGGQVLTGDPISVRWNLALPLDLPFSFALEVDSLSAIFLILLAIVPAAALLFAVGYLDGQPAEAIRRFFSAFLVLLAGMDMVVMAADWVVFLFAWEIMSLASYLLVMWEWRQEQNARAAWIYLLTTHIAGSGILLGACWLSVLGGSFGFADTTQALTAAFATTPVLAHLMVFSLGVGFAAKAASFPLHFWLPEAHGAAPAPVSAILSGLMVKMGVYGLIRLFIFMMPAGSDAGVVWGLLLATLGTVSMVLGNIRSLGEQHAKRLVAQSSIGQVGYIVLSLGMAVALADRAPLLSAVAFAGCLYHVINHAFFKSMLFLTVGSIQHRTGTYDIRLLGGLIRKMPAVAGLTLLGALAIAGTPPLNGFVSKWLIYRAAVFGGLHLPLLAVYGVIAIFISTVSLAAYLKYFGATFLGVEGEGSRKAEAGPEPRPMLAALGLLGTGCILLGLWPQPVVAGALSALKGAPGAAAYGTMQATATEVMGGLLGSAGYMPVAVLLALVVCAGLTWVVWQMGAPSTRFTTPWLGGEVLPDEEIRYGSAHLYRPFLARYAALLAPLWQPRFRVPHWVEAVVDADRWLLGPVYRGYDGLTRLLVRQHRGRVKGYVVWQLLAVVLVIVLLVGTEGGLLRW